MAQDPYATLAGLPVADLLGRFYRTLISGQNIDGTAFSLPAAIPAGVITFPTAPSVAGNAGGNAVTASSANVANAAAVATLPAVAAKTTYITGFQITGSGATAALPVIVTVAGLVTGTMNFIYNFAAGVLVGNTPLIVPFTTPIPASAVNTPIVVTCPASGAGGTNNTASAEGYQL